MTNPAEELQRVYGTASVERIARHLGLTGDPLEALTSHWSDKTARRAAIDAVGDGSRGLLAFMDDIGRRLRGERLKKRWFLHGYADFEPQLMPLVDAGIVLVGNLSAREPVSLETALEQGVLQQWLQVTPGFTGLAGDKPPAREVVEHVEDETKLELSRRLLVVEFNVLNAARFLERARIRLNRDGSPHRSDLKNLAPSIVDRPENGDTVPDPNEVGGWDTLVFVLSLASALGMVERVGDTLRSTGRGLEYFLKPLDERLPLIARAIEQQRAFSEVDAAAWRAAGEPPTTGHGAAGFHVDGGPGATLAGPRGSVTSALRRLSPNDWFDVDETVQTVSSLESRYLATSLPDGHDTEPAIRSFVETVLTVTLTHVGALELGRGSNQRRRARLTDIGRALLGIGDEPDEASGKGAILVEPNFEVTCFLDMASARLLYDLSRFAELSRTSERVVRYRLTGEAVQWGYARGYTADGITGILGEFSAQPVPPAVTFALQDWERLHRRVTVFLSGQVIASTGRSDPEIVQSGVAFTVDDEDHVEMIDAVHTFASAGRDEAIDRALTAHRPTIIDYEGAIVPTLYWCDEHRLRAPVGATDLRTLARLQVLCEQEDDETYRLSPPRIRSAAPGGDGLDRVLSVLRAGLVGGLSAEREIQIKRLLGEAAVAHVQSMDVLTLSSEEDGDRVARLSTVREYLATRLGPRAFRVVPGCVKPLREALEALGIDVVDGDA